MCCYGLFGMPKHTPRSSTVKAMPVKSPVSGSGVLSRVNHRQSVKIRPASHRIEEVQMPREVTREEALERLSTLSCAYSNVRMTDSPQIRGRLSGVQVSVSRKAKIVRNPFV